MILILLWDGLRPDTVTPETTPFLYRKSREGVHCTAGHSVFPTATRVNSASLATGCYPNKHGIVGNSLYVPAINPTAGVTCGDWRNLRRMAELEGGGVLHVPTLAEILRDKGCTVAFCGSGSTGTSYLSNPNATGPVVNWSTAWPENTREEILRRYGSFVSRDATYMERSRFVIEAAQDYILREYSPEVLTVWLSEPDHTQHECGLGSPEALAVLRDIDQLTRHFVEGLERSVGRENLTCLFLSDHGFYTISPKVDPARRLFEAGFKESPDSNDIVYSACNIYLNTEDSKGRIAEIFEFLCNEPWVGGLFGREDLLEGNSNLMPQSAVFSGSHERSADLTLTFSWTDEENEFNVPGCAAASSTNRAGHGSASPFAVNNTFLAWGAGIKKGAVSSVPCGVVDVAPTVLHMLGFEPPVDMDGRALLELLDQGPEAGQPGPDEPSVSEETCEAEWDTEQGRLRQVVQYSVVDEHRYVDHVSII